MSVEVKIGIENSPRELAFTCPDKADDVYAAADRALSGTDAVLSLTDDKGSRVLVPAAKIAYVEVGSAENRRVGFGAA
ncbi:MULTISPECIES: DUF3107 domain-containing protein [Gordonia]|uniref:DUF3107 domain-containing protein n=1 Tax=Gordonia cholesterolivorans TaxID=559625 RepID=A0ABN3H684_9ACTN|nr:MULTISPECIES: DUF3107 domain-containing protein [Gordonia]KJR05316.1 ATP-binding protein [Gordonia sihwensis]KXT55752.1 ATP-binding protein [Gordonia sp. QH-12]MBY4569942.1 ATP-binding protein [Gordonia sihwensis]WFN91986.1 DUF3107 domain-containing protein [Gordonia sihwensis]